MTLPKHFVRIQEEHTSVFQTRLLTLGGHRRRGFFEVQVRDVVLRLSNQEVLWINLFRARFTVGTFPANLGLEIVKL